MDVVILAGGRCDPDLAAVTGVQNRAEIVYRGKTFAETVLEATRHLGEPVLVGGPAGLAVRQVPAGESFIESVRNGLGAVRTDTFLVATVDLPCLTKEAVDDLLTRVDHGAALNYPVIDSNRCEAAFPGMKRTTLRLREGVFTGGNLAVMRTDLMHGALPILDRAYSLRKSPFKLARLVGMATLTRVSIGRMAPRTLRLKDLEKSVGRFLGVPVRAIVTPFAEIGADIDDLAQYNRLIALTQPSVGADV